MAEASSPPAETDEIVSLIFEIDSVAQQREAIRAELERLRAGGTDD